MVKNKTFFLFMPVVFIILALFFYNWQKQGQTGTLEVAFFTLKGSSNAGKWETNSNQASGTAEISLKNNKVINVTDLEIIIAGESLKSINREMDAIIYEMINTSDFPYIIFKLEKIINVTYQGNSTMLITSGFLTIAENTNPVQLKVISRVIGQKVFFEGTSILNSSDYNLDATIKDTIRIGDQITIDFDCTFKMFSEESL